MKQIAESKPQNTSSKFKGYFSHNWSFAYFTTHPDLDGGQDDLTLSTQLILSFMGLKNSIQMKAV